MKIKLILSLLFLILMAEPGFAQPNNGGVKMITETEVYEAQKAWGNAIVEIGEAYPQKKDYKGLAAKLVAGLYGYDRGTVLFKPTKAAERQFRITEEGAVSYFATGIVPEDHGFALQPWSRVRFENSGIISGENSALAMGNYYFTNAKSGEEVKVEYSFGYFRDESGRIRINLHHSSLTFHH